MCISDCYNIYNYDDKVFLNLSLFVMDWFAMNATKIYFCYINTYNEKKKTLKLRLENNDCKQ